MHGDVGEQARAEELFERLVRNFRIVGHPGREQHIGPNGLRLDALVALNYNFADVRFRSICGGDTDNTDCSAHSTGEEQCEKRQKDAPHARLSGLATGQSPHLVP